MKERLLLMIAVITCSTMIAQNKALDLTGTDDLVEIPAFNLSDVKTFTIEAWIKPDGNQHSSAGIVLHRGGDVLGLATSDADKVLFEWQNKYWGGTGVPFGVIGTNTWHHIALVVDVDAATVTRYQDGVADVLSDNTIGAVNLDNIFCIGIDEATHPDKTAWTDRRYHGLIDEVRFWTTARTEQQIKDNMGKELVNPAGETGLLAYYQFNDNTNDTKGTNHGSLLHSVVSPYVADVSWVDSPTPVYSIDVDSDLILQNDRILVIDSKYQQEKLSLYNLAGVCVFNQTVPEGKTSISIEEFSGLYIAVLSQNGDVFTKKVMLTK